MKKLLYVTFLVLLILPVLAFGADVPEGDPIASLSALILSWKSMAPLAKGMAFVVLISQILKSDKLGGFFDKFKYKRVLVTILGQLYAVMLMVSNGSSLMDSILVGLISSGGAVSIYEAIKPLLKK